MAPSRGSKAPASSTPPTKLNDETAVTQQSNSALANAKRNFNYLLHPSSSSSTSQPRLRTRALLRTARYISIFIFWRLVRWAKYIAIGSAVAAVSATALGTATAGVAWLAAPPTIGASVLAAGVWGVGKFAARRLHRRWIATGRDVGEVERENVSDGGVRGEGTYGLDMGPAAVPW